ncbi:MAG: response regulator [Anaerolineae bacterium]|nr:response regulator [Anaerolineae bacterium]
MTHKVLLVEDQQPFIAAALLKRHGDLDILAVGDATEAIVAFTHNEFDAVLLDLRLPGGHGTTILEAIRRIDSTLPIIIITAYDDKNTRDRCRQLGASAFFRKPPDYRKLYHEMMRLIALRPLPSKAVVSLTEEMEAKRNMLWIKTRRLQKLQEKQAMYGLAVPVELQLEIEDLQNEVARLEEELNQ